MRITCPNCGAQYEVPDEVIPQDGRDVQCSNCSETWFQARPDHPPAPPGDAVSPEAVLEETDEDAPVSEPAPEPEPDLAPAPEPAAPTRRELDPSVADILKQEAAHEARMRGTPEPLESQPELGLAPPDTVRAAQQARERAARMRQPDPQPKPSPSRRDLLPDIDEINSTLRTDHGRQMVRRTPDPSAQARRSRSGFARGVAVVMVIAALIVLLYANAPALSAKVPQADGFLNGLVATVDKARFWLDAQVKAFTG